MGWGVGRVGLGRSLGMACRMGKGSQINHVGPWAGSGGLGRRNGWGESGKLSRLDPGEGCGRCNWVKRFNALRAGPVKFSYF